MRQPESVLQGIIPTGEYVPPVMQLIEIDTGKGFAASVDNQSMKIGIQEDYLDWGDDIFEQG